VHPVREQVHHPADGEVRGRAADQPRARLVTAQPAVAVGVAGALRPDDERRVADDQVELLALDRVPERALAQIERHVRQRGGHPRQPQRAGQHVGAEDDRGVPAQVQRLHPAAGAEVERAPDPSPAGRLGEGRGRAADPEDVIGAEGRRHTVQPGAEVGDDPPRRVPGAGLAVRPHVETGPHLRAVALHDTQRDRVDQRERPPSGPLVDVVLQQEEPDESRER
jgi:hypothetical protein